MHTHKKSYPQEYKSSVGNGRHTKPIPLLVRETENLMSWQNIVCATRTNATIYQYEQK